MFSCALSPSVFTNRLTTVSSTKQKESEIVILCCVYLHVCVHSNWSPHCHALFAFKKKRRKCMYDACMDATVDCYGAAPTSSQIDVEINLKLFSQCVVVPQSHGRTVPVWLAPAVRKFQSFGQTVAHRRIPDVLAVGLKNPTACVLPRFIQFRNNQ